ncbi:MAG: filamentous hemagglutinin family protein, partial [Gammaproteobacteria bacterium]
MTRSRLETRKIRKTRKHNLGSSMTRPDFSAPKLKPLAYYIRQAVLPAGLLLSATTGFAGPAGENVVAGSAKVNRPDASTTIINQQTNNVAIDWSNFNIKKNELVQFNQPSSSASALNRIIDNNPTQIFGNLRANGNVLLLNSAGVFFGPTAQVNVGSLIASGLDINTQDFMAGNYNFQVPLDSEGGMVVNQGIMQAATGGSISLVGGAVKNEGLIYANAGSVNLVAGRKVTMDFDGDGLIQFAVDESILENVHDLGEAVSNTGEISAEGGAVLLQGSAAKDVFTNVVNNQGIIKAGSIENVGGKIRLIAGGASNSLINTGTLDVSGTDSVGGTIQIEATGKTNVSGNSIITGYSRDANGGLIAIRSNEITIQDNASLDASGSAAGGTIEIESTDTTIVKGESVITASSDNGEGGEVQILGDKVGIAGATAIDVSGLSGGGTILVGGDFQGSNPDIQNASRTFVGNEVTLNADAVEIGDGGKVIVWSDEATSFAGSISAQGGTISGDGGFVEVSGKNWLGFEGDVNLTANNGEIGTILLDPNTITVQAANPDINGDTTTGDDITAVTDLDDDNLDFNGADSVITSTAVEGLLSGASLKLDAATSIDINDPISQNTNAGVLTLEAPTININQLIGLAGTNSGFVAQGAGGGDATAINVNANITASGASSTGLTFTGPVTIGATLLLSADAMSFSSTIGLGANRLILANAVGNITISSVISGTGELEKAGGGKITLSGTNTYTGATKIIAGTLSVASIGNNGVSGNLGAATNADANLVLGGGELEYTGATASTDRNFTLTAATNSSIDVTNGANTLTISGASTATTGALTKLGAGTLTLSGTNTHTGLTTINAGALTLSGGFAISDTGSVTVNAGTFTSAGGEVIGALNTSVGTTVNPNGTLFVSGGGTIAGTLTGNATFTAGGGGGNTTLTLSGDNNASGYTGLIVVNSGKTIEVTADGALGTAAGNVRVDGGGTLAFSNDVTYSITEILELNGTGVGGVGALHNVSGTNSFAGTIELKSASTLGSTAGTLTVSGAIDSAGFSTGLVGGGSFTLNNTSNDFSTLSITSANDVTIVDANSVTLSGASLAGSLSLTAISGSLTVSGAVASSGSSDAITLVASDTISVSNSITTNIGSVTLHSDTDSTDGGAIVLS